MPQASRSARSSRPDGAMVASSRWVKRYWKGVLAVALAVVLGREFVWAWQHRVTPETVAQGQELFEHHWTAHDPLAGGGDGLGPVFNAKSCAECHHQGGAGGGGANKFNVNAFTALPTQDRTTVRSGVIHAFAHTSTQQESQTLVQSMFPIIPAGQTQVGDCFVARVDFNPLHVEQINTPPLWGLGQIDGISDFAIKHAVAERHFANSMQELSSNFDDVPVGRVRRLPGGAVGKFGWKGQFATLDEFVAAACAGELGLTNPHVSQHAPRQHAEDRTATLDMDQSQFHAMASFVSQLPAPRTAAEPGTESAAAHGRQLFQNVGCAACHTPDLGGVAGVYSDFCLYDLEDDPSQGNYGLFPDVPLPSDEPRLEEWKTPPLWGVADSAPYLHDGRAETLDAAISHHGGAAKKVRDRFRELSKSDQSDVVTFLKSLRAPERPQKAAVAQN